MVDVFLRPDADVTDGSWTTEAGGTSLFGSVDETSAGDSDYIQSSPAPNNDAVVLAFSNPGVTLAEPFVVRYRYKKSGPTPTVDIKVELLQGTTVIASWDHADISETFTTTAQTLTTPQFSSITDFNDLRIRITANPPTAALDIDFTASETLDSRITFTRSSSATRFNSSGTLVSAATDAARFDYNPSTLAARGLLLEEQRTNLELHSGAIDNAVWSGYAAGTGSSSRTANSGTAPDGTNTATLCTINRSSFHWAQGFSQNFTGTVATYTGSVWLKAYAAGDVGKVIDLTLYNPSTIASSGNTQVTLTADWVRYTVSATMAASASCGFFAGYIDGGAGITGTATQSAGTGEIKFLAWGGQVELGSFATSYIPTTSADVTRAADNADMSAVNMGTWYTAPGTFVLDFEVGSIDSAAYNILLSYWNDTNDRLHVIPNVDDIQIIIYDAGSFVGDISKSNVLSANTKHKLAIAMADNDLASCIDGGTITSDTTGAAPTGTSELAIGQSTQSGARAQQLRVSRIRFYNTRKTNAELQSLTT